MDIMNLFGKIQDIQVKIKEATESLKDVIVEADTGGGMVKVKANGLRKLIEIKIDPAIVDKNDIEMLEDLILAAVNKVMDKAQEEASEAIKKNASGVLPNIPGLDLSKFGL